MNGRFILNVRTTPGEIENRGFNLQTHQMFAVQEMVEELKNARIDHRPFWILFAENSVREII